MHIQFSIFYFILYIYKKEKKRKKKERKWRLLVVTVFRKGIVLKREKDVRAFSFTGEESGTLNAQTGLRSLKNYPWSLRLGSFNFVHSTQATTFSVPTNGVAFIFPTPFKLSTTSCFFHTSFIIQNINYLFLNFFWYVSKFH